MSGWPSYAGRLRAMYKGSKANATARRMAHLRAAVFSWGLQPKRWVTLEVPGRSTGRLTRFPVSRPSHLSTRYSASLRLQRQFRAEPDRLAGLAARTGRYSRLFEDQRDVASSWVTAQVQEFALVQVRFFQQIATAQVDFMRLHGLSFLYSERFAQAESRSIGHVMQRGPPRPRPSSLPAMVTTSMPCLRSIVFVGTLRS